MKNIAYSVGKNVALPLTPSLSNGKDNRRAILLWLAACLTLIVLMVMVGGYTRLSGSGLSITEWKPIHGAIPPLSLAEWEEEFALYRASPQYEKVNAGMSLEEFKAIYWPEYLHRLLGRAIGMVFFLPFAWFLAKRRLDKRFALRLAAIFALGGMQGGIGWIMVKSGLVDQPYVSHVKLALHLSMAFLIFALLLWALLDVAKPWRERVPVSARKRQIFTLIFGLLCLQIVYGAFMAGLHAGKIYNTFPTMNGQWIPEGLLAHSPMWLNAIENIEAVQFVHRWLGTAVMIGGTAWIISAHRALTGLLQRRAFHATLLLLPLQFMLGVATLLMVAPLDLSLAHQMIGLALFAAMVVCLHGMYFKRNG